MNRAKYPPFWEKLSWHIRFVRAAGRCEGSPAFPNCQAVNGFPHPVTGSKVVLTVAHLDHDTTNNRFSNLRAMCQRCHLKYDAKHHAENARKTRLERAEKKREAAGQLKLEV